MTAQFRPVLGASALRTLLATVDADNEPNTEGQHRGSAYQDGWDGRFAGLTSQAPSDWRRYVARDAV